MGIKFAIHTYGYYDSMFFILNGIKMIMNSDFGSGIIKLMALIATSYYALLGMAGAAEGKVVHYFLKTGGMLLVVSALLTPKADMLVVDRISGKKDIVTDLPNGFVLPVGSLEAIGAGVTSSFEQAFSTVSSAPYTSFGLIFGQRLVQESRNWRISDPEFARNMDVFIDRCIVLESMIGERFTPNDVITSKDIFYLASEKAGTFREVDFRVKNKSVRYNCKAAANHLKSYFKNELGFLKSKYIGTDFALAGKTGGMGNNEVLSSMLVKNIEIGYSGSFGVKAKAEDIVRQNMMINAIGDHNNSADLYGYTRASDMQKSNWKILGDLAKEKVPLLLNITKGLVYACFIFIAPLMLLSGGMRQYLKYCSIVFSLQIWPALNSILNLFIELYTKVRGAGITGGDITLATFNQAHEAVDTIVLVASGLQITVPFLSFAIVQGGVAGFVHLAGAVQSASSSAASAASNELTSGNRSFDNISKGGLSVDNKSGFKTDLNQSYQEGASQVQLGSGAMMRTHGNGDSSIMSGTGLNTSSGARKFDLNDSTQTGLQQNLTNSLSALQGEEKNLQNAKSATVSSVSDLVSHLAQRESAGETFNYDKMGEQGKALQQSVNHTKTLHDRDGYGWDQAAGASVKTYADAGLQSPNPGGLSPAHAKAGVATDATVSATNSSRQSLDAEEGIINNNDTNKSFNNLAKAAQNESWMKDSNIDNSFAKSTRANYDKMQAYQESVSQRKEEAVVYSDALSASQNSGATDSRDAYHNVEQGVMKRYGVSQNQAHQMIETGDARVNPVWNDIVGQKMGSVITQVKNSRDQVNDIADTASDKFQNDHSSKVNDQGVQALEKQASDQGLNKELIKGNIDAKGERLIRQFSNITDENRVQIDSVGHHNKVVKDGMQKRADEYDAKRLSPLIGVGGQNQASKAFENLKSTKK